mmetsp:Transcript_32571/g.101010  ORF Transcript_32571/g.101010 Transcript_32571/m.101010 type:complete len:107 (-) Transcript_32571:350-670(-)
MLSETAGSFWRRAEAGSQLHRSLPFSDASHGKGTGYCPNTVSIHGAEWTHKDHHDTFRTTYNDAHENGFREPRATLRVFHSPEDVQVQANVPLSSRARRRTDGLGR